MSALVLLATAIFAASVVAIVAYLWWYGMREEAYDFTADEKPRPLPGALGASMEARIAETWPEWESETQALLMCSAEGCGKPAVETLFLRDQVGHVHDCAKDAALVREWCDVVHSAPIVDGECLAAVCTHNDWIAFGQPTPLDPEGGAS